jgi:hypothetical protein
LKKRKKVWIILTKGVESDITNPIRSKIMIRKLFAIGPVLLLAAAFFGGQNILLSIGMTLKGQVVLSPTSPTN